jgi:toxin ParE1/3/4
LGPRAADRYLRLLKRSFRDISANPLRLGSRTLPGILAENVRIYPLAASRRKSVPPVREPRHLIVYRTTEDAIEVGRILHDAMDLARHLPVPFRTP